MRGLSFTSKNNNTYFYNDESGFIESYIENSSSETIHPNHCNITLCDPSDVKSYLFSGYGFSRLILEVSQACNLRCKYCCFSDQYPSTRSHGNKLMSFDTSKKAIDLYFSLFKETENKNILREPLLAFYGGEPLLNFDLIKKSVEYINTNYSQYKVNYNITTNGVLLTKDVYDYLIKNDFSIVVSLDGDKEDHDRNRVKVDGTGSFNEAFNNFNSLKKDYPNFKKLSISTCYDYYTDLLKISDFIEKNDISVANIVKVLEHDTSYFNKFTDEDKKIFNEKYYKLQEEFIYRVKNKVPLNNLHLALFAYRYVSFLLHSLKYQPIRDYLPYTCSCIPGEKLFISLDGSIHMCERINSHFPIGHINTGLDYDKITEVINKINAYQPMCRKCNVSRLCTTCFAQATKSDEIFISKDSCEKNEKAIKEMLISYVNFMEEMPKEFTEMITTYFNSINDTSKRLSC